MASLYAISIMTSYSFEEYEQEIGYFEEEGGN